MKGDKVKEELLTVAVCLLVERGDTRKVTYRDIASKAEVPISKISYYFPTRRELLEAVSEFIIDHTQQSPLKTFLEKNRPLLHSREGQIFFIDDLFRCFHRYFLGVQCVNLNCGLALHVILRSTEYTSARLRKTYHQPIRDARAFLEIYQTITGDDDMEKASFLYSTTLYALAHRLVEPKPLEQSGGKFTSEDDFNVKFLYFCRKQLMLGLGIWESPEAERKAWEK